jgi:membrane protein involved in colicin uptake
MATQPTPVEQQEAAAKAAADKAAADAAAKAEVARKAALIAETAPAKSLTAGEIVTRIREQLTLMKNPNNTSAHTEKGCDRIEALLGKLDPLLPVVK